MKTGKNSCEKIQQTFGLVPVVIGICGFSGSGKTTLIESVLPILKSSGLTVAVLKHDAHGLVMDRPGKDTDRFARAGAASVFAHSAAKAFQIYPVSMDLKEALKALPVCLDLIIVEGHKNSPLRRVWLDGPKSDKAPTGFTPIATLPWDAPDRVECLLEIIKGDLKRNIDARPLRYGLMVGGKSTRMGRPKALLRIGDETLAERVFRLLNSMGSEPVLLGSGPLPESMTGRTTLPDPPGFAGSLDKSIDKFLAGPMAGLLAAARWAPDSTWIICAVDMPGITPEAFAWLISMRRPGVWAVLPKLPDSQGVEPLFACYEPMIFPYIESLAQKGRLALHEVAKHPKAITPQIPERLVPAFVNINTPQEWQRTVIQHTGGVANEL